MDFTGNTNYSLSDPQTLKQYASKLESTAESFLKSCTSVSQRFNNIAQYLTFDGSTQKDITDIVEVYNEVIQKSNIKFQDLVSKMNNWADMTMRIEEETVQKINQLNSGLNDISALLNQIK